MQSHLSLYTPLRHHFYVVFTSIQRKIPIRHSFLNPIKEQELKLHIFSHKRRCKNNWFFPGLIMGKGNMLHIFWEGQWHIFKLYPLYNDLYSWFIIPYYYGSALPKNIFCRIIVSLSFKPKKLKLHKIFSFFWTHDYKSEVTIDRKIKMLISDIQALILWRWTGLQGLEGCDAPRNIVKTKTY